MKPSVLNKIFPWQHLWEFTCIMLSHISVHNNTFCNLVWTPVFPDSAYWLAESWQRVSSFLLIVHVVPSPWHVLIVLLYVDRGFHSANFIVNTLLVKLTFGGGSTSINHNTCTCNLQYMLHLLWWIKFYHRNGYTIYYSSEWISI